MMNLPTTALSCRIKKGVLALCHCRLTSRFDTSYSLSFDKTPSTPTLALAYKGSFSLSLAKLLWILLAGGALIALWRCQKRKKI